MAGCGGARCSCLVQAGQLIEVVGTGNLGDPYIISSLSVAACAPVNPGLPPPNQPVVISQVIRDGLLHLEVDCTSALQDTPVLFVYVDIDGFPTATTPNRVHLFPITEIHRLGTVNLTATLDLEVYDDIAASAQPNFQVGVSYVNCEGFEGPISAPPVTPPLSQGRRRREEIQGNTRNAIMDGGLESYEDLTALDWLIAAGHDFSGADAWRVDAGAARSGQRGLRYDPILAAGNTTLYWNAQQDRVAGQALTTVFEGQDHQHVCWVRANGATHNGLDVRIQFVDPTGAVLSTATTNVPASSLPVGVWTPVSVIDVAPAGSLKVSMSVLVTDTATPGTIDIDDAWGWTMEGGDVVDDVYTQTTFGATNLPGAPIVIVTDALQLDYIGQRTLIEATCGVGMNLTGNEAGIGYCVIGGVSTIGQRLTNPAGGGGISGPGGGHGHGIGGSTGGGGTHNHFNSGVTTAAGGGASQPAGGHGHANVGHVHFSAGHFHGGGFHGHGNVGNHTHPHGSHTHIWLGISTNDGGHSHGSGSLSASGVGDHTHSIPAGSTVVSMIAWDHQVRRFTPAGNTVAIDAQGQTVVGTAQYVSGTVMALATRLRHEER